MCRALLPVKQRDSPPYILAWIVPGGSMNDLTAGCEALLPEAGIGEDILRIAADQAVRTFGARLVAVYALGSLAHGGFCPAVSDVDLALVLDDPAGPADAKAVDELARVVRSRKEPL